MNSNITSNSLIIAHIQGYEIGTFNYSKTLKDGSMIFKKDDVLCFKDSGRGRFVSLRVLRDGTVTATNMNLKNEIRPSVVHRYTVFEKGTDRNVLRDQHNAFYGNCLADHDNIILVRFEGKQTVAMRYAGETEKLVMGYTMGRYVKQHLFVAEDGSQIVSHQIGGNIEAKQPIVDLKILKKGVTRGEVKALCENMNTVVYKEQKRSDLFTAFLFNDNRGGIGLIVDEQIDNVRLVGRYGNRKRYTMSAKLVLHTFKTREEAFAAVEQYHTKGFTKLKTRDIMYKPDNMLLYNHQNEELSNREKYHTTPCGIHCRVMHKDFQPYANLMPTK